MTISSKIYKFSMIIQALLWIVLSIVSFIKKDNYLIISILMFANGILFFVFSQFFDCRKIVYFLILFFISTNIVLTFTDQMGFLDYFVLLFSILSASALLIHISANKKKKTLDKTD